MSRRRQEFTPFQGRGFKLDGVSRVRAPQPAREPEHVVEVADSPQPVRMQPSRDPSRESDGLSEAMGELLAFEQTEQIQAVQSHSFDHAIDHDMPVVMKAISNMKVIASSWLAELPEHKYTRDLREQIDEFLIQSVSAESYGDAHHNGPPDHHLISMKNSLLATFRNLRDDADTCLGKKKKDLSVHSSSSSKRGSSSTPPKAAPKKKTRKVDDDDSD
eukprot:34748-Pyramimonas_sp.AAC.2